MSALTSKIKELAKPSLLMNGEANIGNLVLWVHKVNLWLIKSMISVYLLSF